MVQRSERFTPQTLLSAPRRSAGVPHPDGTKVLYTTSSYSFETHKKDTELRILEVKTGAGLVLAQNEDVSDLNWMQGDEFACLCAGKDGVTTLCIGNASWGTGPDDSWKRRHYVAGSIDAPASNLKIAKLDDYEWAVVVSAQASKDGSLFNSATAKTTHSTGRLYDGLYVRHWDRYETKEKNALWYGKLYRDKHAKFRLSKLTNATTRNGFECPVAPFGGTDNFDICKDCIMFTAKDTDLNPALNVKTNVYILRISSWDKDSNTLLKVVVPGFEGASTSPVLSPDGKKGAFLSMKTAGYEADKNQIFVLPELSGSDLIPQRAFASTSSHGSSWDRSPSSICFSADGKSLLAVAEDYGTAKLYTLNADLTKDTEPKALTTRGFVTDYKPMPGGQVFFTATSLIDNSLYAMVDPVLPPSKPPQNLITWSHSNSGEGNKFGLHPSQVSSIWTPASNKKILKEVHSLVVKPSNFDSSKKYPVAYLIHGGPQGSWADNWSTRWNLAVFAEQGYIVVAPNPTGSTGYGQEFTDSIRKNWGGDPYQDIVNCFEWVGENMKEADNDRAVALGASYGGYMMNWRVTLTQQCHCPTTANDSTGSKATISAANSNVSSATTESSVPPACSQQRSCTSPSST